ncbi:MAG: tetratricopeptide repeat protein [Oligoflexia bacterium]|nr:tetratricopeptide repeat protein [Oligoflexia bacterium]
MTQDTSSFIERYQILYEKDPNSKVFAPLAEAYRRMGLLEEAIDLAERGVKRHPNFASGRVALGKCYFQKREYDEAVSELTAAVELSPENLLAHQLLAECFVKINKSKEALDAYKMVLFLNPQDSRVADIVKKLESKLYAEPSHIIEEDFSMEKLAHVSLGHTQSSIKTGSGIDLNENDGESTDFDRELAVIDSLMNRGDWSRAVEKIDELLASRPNEEKLLSRKKHIQELSQTGFNWEEWISPLEAQQVESRKTRLESVLQRIETRRKT